MTLTSLISTLLQDEVDLVIKLSVDRKMMLNPLKTKSNWSWGWHKHWGSKTTENIGLHIEIWPKDKLKHWVHMQESLSETVDSKAA